MRSLLGRFHRPFARSAEEQLLLLNNLGDGSTLSLDFTTGILDPRLTFTRSTNATFINSNGLVQWANSNMYWNTAFEGLSGTNPSLTSSGWGYAFSTGNAVFNGDKTVTITTTASDRRALFRSSGLTGGGLRVVASVDVTIHSGSLQASQVIVTGTPTNAQHYVNGTIWNASHPLWNGGILPVGSQFNISYATDSLTSGTTSMYFGVGCTSAIAGSATFSNPRWTMWNGSGTVPYYPNTSATNGPSANYFKSNDYQAPRFDYDPTAIGTPRGLLIEGSAVNYMLESTSLSGYSNSNMVAVSSGSETDPEGNANSAKQIYAAATTGYHGWYRNVTAGTNTTVTVSIWAKARDYTFLFLSDAASGRAAVRFNLQTGATDNNFGAGYVSARATQYTNGWWRCEMTVSVTASTGYGWTFVGLPTSGATLNAYGAQYTGTGNAADGIYCYGFQVEGGSGASSYIPTGASTAQRLFDSCVMTGTNFSSWFAGATEGVLYTQFEKPRSQSGTIGHDHASVGSQYGSGTGFTVYSAYNNYYPTTLLWPTGGAIFPGGIASAVPAVTKQAGKWFGGNDATNYANGVQGTTSAGTGTLAPNMLSIGANSASGTAATRDWLNACVRSVKFWPVALPDSQIISLTT